MTAALTTIFLTTDFIFAGGNCSQCGDDCRAVYFFADVFGVMKYSFIDHDGKKGGARRKPGGDELAPTCDHLRYIVGDPDPR